MAKISDAKMAAMMAGLNVAQRARAMGIDTGKMTPNDKAIMKRVDSAKDRIRGFAQEQQKTFGAMPDFVPATREESGLVADGMTLDESQLSALTTLHNGHHVCLMGPAGSGKTTLVKRAIANHIYGGDGFDGRGIKSLGGKRLNIAVCAFTGIATQVVKSTLPDWMHPSVMTIHSLLEFVPADGDGSMFIPSRNKDKQLDQDIIFVDEVSMLGVDLWHTLLEAMRPRTRIILIGDLNQLTPVADTPFYPLVLAAAANEERNWSLAELTTIHRQKGPGANRIVDCAHQILNGTRPTFDFELNAAGQVVNEQGKPVEDAKPNADWRVINIHVDLATDKAHTEIIRWCEQFRRMAARGESRNVYDPYADLLLCCGNGWELDARGALIEQSPINQSLSELIVPDSEENPTYMIECARGSRQYTVGDRVMAKSNEAPNAKNRVTNGMLGVITKITPNGDWKGDRKRFGSKKEVEAYMKSLWEEDKKGGDESVDDFLSSFASTDTGEFTAEDRDMERQASHIIDVEWKNGAERVYSTAAQVAGTQLGYAITTHKAQGSQADTVFIVCHSAVAGRLNREWLYTAFTRAKKRVIVFSTNRGMRKAVATQQIFGRSLREKIDHYSRKVKEAGKMVRLSPEEV